MPKLPQDYRHENKQIWGKPEMSIRASKVLIASRIFILPVTLLFLNLFDVLTTNYGLSLGLAEANPLFSDTIVPFKFLGCGILFITSYFQNHLYPETRKVNCAILGFAITLYTFVILNNVLTILRFG